MIDSVLKVLEYTGYPRINIANADYDFYKQNPNLQWTNPQFRRTKLWSGAVLGYLVFRPFGFQRYGVFLVPLGYFIYCQILTHKNKDLFNQQFISGLRAVNLTGINKNERIKIRGEWKANYPIKSYKVQQLNLTGIEKMVQSLPKSYFN